MYRAGDNWLIHRDCLPSAPLPPAHWSLILDSLEAFGRENPGETFDFLQYNLDTRLYSAMRLGPTLEPPSQLLPEWLRSTARCPRPAVCVVDCLTCELSSLTNRPVQHRSAIKRRRLSRPIKCAMRDGLISADRTVLDYGCGAGIDVAMLRGLGITALGWDPVSFSNASPPVASVVNLGYVLNVIADPKERERVLHHAFGLATDLLIVSALIANGTATQHVRKVPFADGMLTSRGTFQKLYKQSELRLLIDTSLGVKCYCRELGVFYVNKRAGL